MSGIVLLPTLACYWIKERAMTTSPEKILFLPGASGNVAFWHPAAAAMSTPAIVRHLGWPGFGNVPANPNVSCLQHLAALALDEVDRPTALVAQSMGGVVAVLLALERPALITHLVLSVTSGGMDLSAFGAADWRAEFEAENPKLPRWFLDDRTDLTARLCELRMPVLLLWGGSDPISPVAVGECLMQLIPNASLQVFADAGHDLGHSHAEAVARLIDAHLAS
ncbi:alpha/beta fold hydrolase [Pseudomonas putida]|uniref:alpha/beta fold hydrolase n=1 Tax=Pseudomonas putida TaxID=303 RepID=UPI0024E0F6F5|nr:alpha/beta fold hydrolase [Pseudomonas putida]